MATVILAIGYDGSENVASVANRLAQPSGARYEAMNRLAEELIGIAGGMRRADVTLLVESGDTTKATADVTLGGADLAADDTISIAGVTLTWKASAANENQVAFTNTEADDADALAAAINAHTDLSGMVTAESDGTSKVTITAAIPGNLGRYALQKAETNSGAMALSATSLGGITSAVESTPRTYLLGGGGS